MSKFKPEKFNWATELAESDSGKSITQVSQTRMLDCFQLEFQHVNIWFLLEIMIYVTYICNFMYIFIYWQSMFESCQKISNKTVTDF